MADNVSIGTINYKIAASAKEAKKEVSSLSDKLKGLKTALKAAGSGVLLGKLKELGPKIVELTEKQAKYITSLNMFRNTLHDTREELKSFVDQAEELTGLDATQVMDFMTGIQRIGEGYGLASDEVQKMSQNLAQLAGDLTTLGFSYEETTTKLKAGFRGAIKPIAELGVAIDQNSLQELAYSKGIEQRVSTMTKAQKTELIYLQIMQQTASVQGNLSRAMVTPQMAMNKFKTTMEKLARSIGSIFIPIMMKIIPVVEAVANALTKAAEWLAALFGFDLKKDYTFNANTLADISDGIEDIGDAASGTAKELKKMLMPFDELNNVNFDTGGGSGSGAVGTGGSLGLDMPEIYDFFGNLGESNIDKIAKEFTDNLPLIADAIALFLAVLGKTKAAAALEAITGIGQIIHAMTDMAKNKPNFDNITELIEGIGRIGFAIGLYTGNWKLAAVSIAIVWITEAIREIVKCWDEIKKGNWENVDKAKLILGAIGVITLIGIALSKLSKFKKVKNPVANVAETVSEASTGTSKLTTGLIKLDKNLGLGLLAILAVSAAALTIVGTIWGLGKILTQVGKAWEEVFDNRDSILAGMGFGIIILAAVGVVTGLLGSVGSPLVIALGVGLVVLLEIEAAAALLLGGIWAIAWALTKIGEEWEKVYANQDNILQGMQDGIAILCAVAAISGGLGVLTVATFGLLPVAIGLGAATLLEVEAAAISFFDAIEKVGNQLNNIGTIWKSVLEHKDDVEAGIQEGINYLVAVAEISANLGVANVKSGGTLHWAIDSGTDMLNKIDDAAVNFVDAILEVGKKLADIGDAWKPVLENKDAIERGLEEGIIHLVSVAQFSSDLGVANVKSGGLLYIAIKSGTKMLEMLEESLVKFVEKMKETAQQLNELAPVLQELNEKLPDLNENLKKYVDFMEEFAGYAGDYASSSNAAGFSGFVSRIVSFFTGGINGNPIRKFSDSVGKNGEYAEILNQNLIDTNDELLVTLKLVKNYLKALELLDELTGQNMNWKFQTNIFVDMKEVGAKIATGLADGIKANYWRVGDAIDEISRNALSWGRGYDYGWNFGNAIASGISGAMRNYNFPRLKGDLSTASDEVSIKFRAYASGGYPERGQLFMANEAGPELVGNIGNRAAVANNDQITEGIATATYNAFTKAMADTNTNTEMNPYFDIRIGDDKVYSGYAKQKNNESNMYGVVM